MLKALNPGIRTPIVLAPMAGASGGALAGEVCLAGGFGFLAPSPGEGHRACQSWLDIS
jgi:nitronate monooxygenase